MLVVWKLDRLGRSLVEMMRTIDSLRTKEIHFRSLTEQFDSDTAHGRFALQMHGAMAEYFLDLNRERTMEGLKAALARGRKGGRPEEAHRCRSRSRARSAAIRYDLDRGDRPAPRGQPGYLLQLLPPSSGTQPSCRRSQGDLIAMPIRREHRFYYPIDWPQLSAVIRFRRAGGACEGCGRPHGADDLPFGRWTLVGCLDRLLA